MKNNGFLGKLIEKGFLMAIFRIEIIK